MAYKRTKVGAVLKSKDSTQPDYIKIDTDVTLKKGDILNLESKKSKLASLEKNIENGKLSGDLADKIRDGIEKAPFYEKEIVNGQVVERGFIRFEIVKVSKD